MYKAKLWDEDKWDIHSSSYSFSKHEGGISDDKKDVKYHEQKYGAEDKNPSSDYMKKEEAGDKDENKEKDVFDFEEEKKENNKIDEEEIPFKAAKQIFDEKKHEANKPEQKKEIKTIEEAIKKAIEEEKKVMIMDN